VHPAGYLLGAGADEVEQDLLGPMALAKGGGDVPGVDQGVEQVYPDGSLGGESGVGGDLNEAHGPVEGAGVRGREQALDGLVPGPEHSVRVTDEAWRVGLGGGVPAGDGRGEALVLPDHVLGQHPQIPASARGGAGQVAGADPGQNRPCGGQGVGVGHVQIGKRRHLPTIYLSRC